jgi:hypothetical protein
MIRGTQERVSSPYELELKLIKVGSMIGLDYDRCKKKAFERQHDG